MARAVFLDRDGVLIRTHVRGGRPYAITEGEPAEILDGVEEACKALREAGFRLVMVTNQPDIANGKASRAFVDSTNQMLVERLGLDQARVCPHDERDNCNCRKPKPGMLLDAARELSLDLPASFMVGDRWRDIEAGLAAGCRTVLIDCGYDEKFPSPPDQTVKSLLEALPWICGLTE